MKKIIYILVFVYSLYAFGNEDVFMKKLGYKDYFSYEDKKDTSLKVRNSNKGYFTGNIYDSGGYLSNSGLTGLIDIPNAYILKTGESAFGYSYIYRDGIVYANGNFVDLKQTQKTTHLIYGMTENMEVGFNFIDFFGEGASYNNQNVSLVSMNLKCSFVFENTVVAIGGHYTDLTPTDQLLMPIPLLENSNSFFVTVSDKLTPYLSSTFMVKSSFMRSISTNAGFSQDDISYTTSAVGFDYSRIEGIHIITELKKLSGEYISGSSDFVINAAFRIKNNKMRNTLYVENINNSSDKIYGYTLNYNF